MFSTLAHKLQRLGILQPLAVFGLWWVALQAFAVIAAQRVDVALPDHAYAWVSVIDVGKSAGWPGWVALHDRWDSGFYIWIAQSGYQHDNAAFLPLYPLCLRLAALGWSILARAVPADAPLESLALLVSNVSALGAAIGLYCLARLDLDERGARHALFCLLIFPTAFFLTTIYTEALFLLWAVLSFYCARRGWWWLAGGLGFCAALTRVAELWLFPALLVEWWLARGRHSWGWLALMLTPLAFLGFEGYLRCQGLSFFATEKDVFGRWPLAPGALWANLEWDYARLHAAAQVQHFLEIGLGLGVLILSLLAGRQFRLSYGIFGLLCVVGPLLTGRFVSVERYALVAFPAFLILGRHRDSVWVEYGYTLGALLLLGLYTLLFVQGYWAG